LTEVQPITGSPTGGERNTKMNKILIAYDGEQPARRALDLAAELSQRFDARVGVVSVVPVHPGRAPVDPWDDRPVHTAQLAEARTLLAERGIEAVLHEPAGDPASAIEYVAGEFGYDVVVVGSRGLGTIERFLQGSVSEHVSTHSTATVIVAR
jgi:nucleotide-binding universal stress UspA family protein